MQLIVYIVLFMVYIFIGMLHLYHSSETNRDRLYGNMLQCMISITFWPLSMIYNFKRFVTNKIKPVTKSTNKK